MKDFPNGLRMHKNFIPPGIPIDRIMQLIETDIIWSNALNRKTIHYGYEYDYGIREPHTRLLKKGKPPPKWLECLGEILYTHNIMRNQPNQIIINKYEPGEGIGAHRDHYPIFDNDIATLSLGSEYIMEFKNRSDKTKSLSINLPIGSLLVFGDDARYNWTHEIKKRKSDIIVGKKQNRGARISITFRTVMPIYKGLSLPAPNI
tara:strand:+ start:226 stop:837 length:612 start_codon:yes stop_codon:yes gene_type:complete